MNITPFSPQALWRTEHYTDQTAGDITRFIPVLDSGERDPLRTEVFSGTTNLSTNRGPMPIQFPIHASSLAEACEKWTSACSDMLTEMESQQTRNRIMQGVGVAPSKLKNGG